MYARTRDASASWARGAPSSPATMVATRSRALRPRRAPIGPVRVSIPPAIRRRNGSMMPATPVPLSNRTAG